MSTEIAKFKKVDFNFRVNFWQTFRIIIVPLFLITVLGTSLDQWITLQMEKSLMSPNGTSAWVWAYGGLSVIVSLIYPLSSALLILSAKMGHSPLAFIKRFFNQSLIETMRAWGRVMLWSFLFILPGLYKFIQFAFVPFIVCLDPAYQNGEKDALETSKKLSHGRMFQIAGLFFVFSILAPLVISVFEEDKLVWKTPFSALLICFVEMLLNLCFIHVLWKIYQRSVGHEPSLSMERN